MIAQNADERKTETKAVAHMHGYSVYNDTVSLEFTLNYDVVKNCFLEKNTEIVSVIIIDGGVKSGGYAKFDLSVPLNENPSSLYEDQVRSLRTIPLTKCPDPNACVQVTFTFHKLSETPAANQMSTLNTSSRDFNLSRMDFSEDHKASTELVQMSDTIQKFQQLAEKLKTGKLKQLQEAPTIAKKIQILQGENTQLRRTIANLEDKIKKIEQQTKSDKRELEKQVQELEKTLQRKNKQIRENQASNVGSVEQEKLFMKLSKKQSQVEELQKKIVELEENLSRQQEEAGKVINFGSNIFDKNAFDNEFNRDFNNNDKGGSHFNIGYKDDSPGLKAQNAGLQARIQQLQREQGELQIQIAMSSNKIAEIFNVAYEVGGAKLLDQLQRAIGLTEEN